MDATALGIPSVSRLIAELDGAYGYNSLYNIVREHIVWDNGIPETKDGRGTTTATIRGGFPKIIDAVFLAVLDKKKSGGIPIKTQLSIWVQETQSIRLAIFCETDQEKPGESTIRLFQQKGAVGIPSYEMQPTQCIWGDSQPWVLNGDIGKYVRQYVRSKCDGSLLLGGIQEGHVYLAQMALAFSVEDRTIPFRYETSSAVTVPELRRINPILESSLKASHG